MKSGALFIETDMAQAELRPFLEKYAPWRVDIAFSNGLRTTDFATAEPFNRHPLLKAQVVEQELGSQIFENARVLDVGFNCGYTSIYLASKRGAIVTGIEVWERHLQVAEFLAKLSKVSAEFILENAETFSRPETFDTILHLGTLYHLPNPFLSLYNSAKNLRKGGTLALETTAYIGSDDPTLNKFVHGFGNDTTNFWALSKGTIEKYFEVLGLENVRLLREVELPVYESEMSRVLYTAQRP